MGSKVISPRKLFESFGYAPHPGQVIVHKSRARHRVAACGRRYGKSNLGGAELLIEAAKARIQLPYLFEKGLRKEFWIVGPEYTDSEKEFRWLYDRLKSKDAPFDRPGTYYNAHDSDMQLSLYGGKFLVLGKSARHPERLVGEGLNGVIMAEAAKQRETTWTKYLRPTLSDFMGWSLHTSTPEGRNWFYDRWVAGQSEENEDWESWRRPAWLNTYVYPKGARDPEVKALRQDLTSETFSQEIAANFTEFAGRVFKDWDDEVHVKDLHYDPAMPIYAAVDYGFTNPFVWLLVQVSPVDGTVYILDEFYQDGLTIDEAAAMLVQRGLVPNALRTFYPDPASPGDSRALEQRLKIRGQGGTGGELNDRLRLIRAALKIRNTHLELGDSERRPKLFVNRLKCPHTIHEFNTYRYPKERDESVANAKELPMKKDDHTPEALGRLMIGLFGKDNQAMSYQTKADMSAAS